MTKFIEPRKAWTIACLVNVKLCFLLCAIDFICSLLLGFEHSFIGIHETLTGQDIFAYEIFQVIDVLRMVEFKELLSGGMSAFIDVHFSVKVEGLYQRVSHCHSFWLHRMVFVVKEFPDIVVMKISYFTG